MAKGLTAKEMFGHLKTERGEGELEMMIIILCLLILAVLVDRNTKTNNLKLEALPPSSDVIPVALPDGFPVTIILGDGASRLDEREINKIIEQLYGINGDCFSQEITLLHDVDDSGDTLPGEIHLNLDQLTALGERGQEIARELFLACKPVEPTYFPEARLVTISEDGTQIYWIGNHGTAPIFESRGTGENSGQTRVRVFRELETDLAIAFQAVLDADMPSKIADRQRFQELAATLRYTALLDLHERRNRIADFMKAQATSNLDELFPALVLDPSQLLDLYPLDTSDTE